MSNELTVTFHNGDQVVVRMPTLNALQEFEAVYGREPFHVLKGENVVSQEPIFIFVSAIRSIQ